MQKRYCLQWGNQTSNIETKEITMSEFSGIRSQITQVEVSETGLALLNERGLSPFDAAAEVVEDVREDCTNTQSGECEMGVDETPTDEISDVDPATGCVLAFFCKASRCNDGRAISRDMNPFTRRAAYRFGDRLGVMGYARDDLRKAQSSFDRS